MRMVKDTASVWKMGERATEIHELISTAYHEAGHTAYALLNFMKVTSVSVFRSKRSKRAGVTCYSHPTDFDSIKGTSLFRILSEIELGVRYAGQEAEKMLFKSLSGSDHVPQFIKDGASEDIKRADSFIRKHNLLPHGKNKKRSYFKKRLLKKVQGELSDNWDSVTLIAHSLYHHRKLTFDDLQKLLTTKTRNKKFWKSQFKKMIAFYGKL